MTLSTSDLIHPEAHCEVVRHDACRPSVEAIERLEAAGRRRSNKWKVYWAIRNNPGKTCGEIAEILGMETPQIHPRLAGLRHDELVWKSGERICTVRGTLHATWRAVEIPKRQLELELT